MADKKHFIVLGLGSFGEALAVRLAKNGCRVTGVDASPDRVERLKNALYEPIIADVTVRESLEHLAMADADAVFISLGESQNMTPSLLATLHASQLGARRIVVKGLSAEHGTILKMLGVERVVFPETEMAVELADRMTWPNVLDYMPIDPEYSFVEITVPESLAGTTLLDADLRRRFNVWVIGMKDALTGKVMVPPDPEMHLTEDQLLVIIGKQDDLNRFRALK